VVLSCKDGGRYILAADEVDLPPVRVEHKSHVTLLSALARPQYNDTTRQWFDGLIDIYTVGELDIYICNSSTHRPGDIKWSNVNIDRDLYQKMLVDLVLPDMKKKVSASAGHVILQQDRAKSHLPEDDEVIKAKVMELYGDPNAAKLYTQPAQSADLNVNELGFFNSSQMRYYETSSKDSSELIEMVEEAFKTYHWKSLNRIWLTLQSVMNMIIKERGGNKF
jgi:hypothetical protein